MAQVRAHVEGQQHPIKLYLVVWGWLFVLSTCSFLVDYFDLQGYLRWFLILLFMIVKAGLIVAIFMHMAWERLALTYAILVPPGAVLLFGAIMAFESDYTHVTRVAFFETGGASAQTEILASAKSGSRTENATPPAATPPDELKKEVEKHGLDVSKPEVEFEGATSPSRAALPRRRKPGRPRRRAAIGWALPRSKAVLRPPTKPLNRSFMPCGSAIRYGRSPKPNMAAATATNIILS